jgi:hypothetical protein
MARCSSKVGSALFLQLCLQLIVVITVLAMNSLTLPIPEQTTALTCTLNNGIHFVTTPECKLGADCKIGQEFELYEMFSLLALAV